MFRAGAQVAATYAGRAHNLDNLKEGVLTPDIYDPALNPLYRDVLAHYGVVALPCRVGDPDRAPKSTPTCVLRRVRRKTCVARSRGDGEDGPWK